MEKQELYQAWVKAKKAETNAKDKRIEIEKQIEMILPAFDEKSKTWHDEGFTLNIKKSETWSFEQELWKKTRENIAPELRCEKIKYDVDTKGLEFLKTNNPDIYKQVSNCVNFKTGKTSFVIEKEKK